MKKIALVACALLLVGCSAPSPGSARASGSASTTAAATSFASPAAFEGSGAVATDAVTCEALFGTDDGVVAESAQFLTDLSELDETTAAEAVGLADELKGVADTSSEQLREALTVMQEPLRDMAVSYENRETFQLEAEPFKAAGNELVAICEPLMDGPTAAEATVEASAEAEAEASAEAEAEASAEAEAEASAEAEAEAGTFSQQNALGAARSYLEYSAFSRTGLISQLEYEDYSTKDATWAVDRVTVDWNEQAVKSAKNYLEYSSFSRTGLIDQLIYEGFSRKQAEHGVSKTGL